MWNSSSSSLSISKPQRKKKKGWGRALAIQSQADLFKRCRLFIGMVFLDYFVLSASWPFRLKVKVLKYPEKPSFRFFSLSLGNLDSWHSKRLFKKRWSVWLLVWFDDRVFIWTNHVRFSRVAFLRNGILLRRLQTLHWKLSKNGFIRPLSSLSLGCSTDVIIRVLLLKSLLVLAATLLSVIIRILKLWIPYCLCEPGIPTPCRGRNVNLLGLALSLNLIQQVTKPHLYAALKFYHNSLSAQPHISSRAVGRRLVMKLIYSHFLNWHT